MHSKSIKYRSERGKQTRPLLLSHEVNSVDYSHAKSYHNAITRQDVVEFSFKKECDFIFYSWDDSRSARYLDSDQKIIVVKDEIGRTGVFFMTLIADRVYSRKHKHESLSDMICNDGLMNDYSGLVVYSRPSGTIVRANRYRNGVLISAASIYSIMDCDKSWDERISSVVGSLSIMRIKRHPATKGSGNDTIDEWWNNDSTGFLLDSAICVADTAEGTDPIDDPFDPFADLGGSGGWSGGSGNSGGNYDEPDPGSDVGGGNLSGGGGSSEDINVGYLTLGDNAITIEFSEDLNRDERALFLSKMEVIKQFDAINRILSAIMNLNDFSNRISILVLRGESMGLCESGRTSATLFDGNTYRHATLRLNVEGETYGYIEEFFHAYQYLVTPRSERAKNGDLEFEAKAFIAQLLRSVPDDEIASVLYGNASKFLTILEYVEDRTEEKRINALQAFVSLGYMNFELSYEGASLSQNLDDILTSYYNFYPNLN